MHSYKLDRAGMARLFGELEAEVMEALWRLGEGTVSAVSAEIGTVAQYTTVQTVMTRLAEKGLLERALLAPGGAYLYRPSESRDALVARVSRELVTSLLAEFGDAAVVGLLDAVDTAQPEQLTALRRVIDERRKQAGG